MKRLSLKLQDWIAHISVPFTFLVGIMLLRFVFGYRWDNLKTFREKIREVIKQNKGPLILCPNHLTMIDSLLLIWAMAPPWKNLFLRRYFPWNTPEKRNFSNNPFFRFYCYIGKCLPVIRQGPETQMKIFLEKIKFLMSRRQSLMMFPEGTRSVSGKVDTQNFTYGIGKIIQDMHQNGLKPTVLCLYLRGKKQKGKSSVPPWGDRFYVAAEIVEPKSQYQGLRAAREMATQIIQRLAGMELSYFNRRV